MAQSFECLLCKHSFDSVDDPKLKILSFILFVFALILLFTALPLGVLLFGVILFGNLPKCPRCRSRKLLRLDKSEKLSENNKTPRGELDNTPIRHGFDETNKKRMSGWTLFIGGLALFLIVFLGFLTWLSISKPKSDGNLPGFALSVPVQHMGNITYYTYQPDGLEDYSITIATGFSELGQHKGGREDLERSQKDISGINVLFGYQEELIEQGVTLLVPYAKLAFDFEYKGEFYSGEVSNLQSNPSKKQLMGILEDFIEAMAGLSS